MKAKWLAGATLAVMLPAAHAASFDCAKASSRVEKLICSNPPLSELDDKFGKVYQQVMSKADDEQKTRIVAEQKHWLKYTRNVCEELPCFKHAYWSRQAELETFFAPHSPLYKKESEKAEAVKRLLATEPLYLSTGTDRAANQFCTQMFDDLKQMKNIRFVDPIVQTQSYEDPALDPWKKQCKDTRPLHFSYVCDGRFSVLYADDIPDYMAELNSVCGAAYGLPPFKLFEIPEPRSAGKKHYVFYSDDDYGPMNHDWDKPNAGGGSSAGFDKLIFPGCQHKGSLTRARGGARNGPNYNSVITHRGKYYLMDLYKDYGSYTLSVELAVQGKPYRVCDWSSVKHNTINQGSK